MFITINAYIDNHSARLDPVSRDHFGSSDGCHDNISIPTNRSQVFRARVTDGYRRVGGEQQLGNGLSNNGATPNHNRIRTTNFNTRLLQQTHATRWRARYKPLLSRQRRPRLIG